MICVMNNAETINLKKFKFRKLYVCHKQEDKFVGVHD